MRLVYFTSGITGAGRIVPGISIGNALHRAGIACEYTIISNSPMAFLANGFNHIEIPIEDSKALSRKNYESSMLYTTLARLAPDVLIVELQWFPLQHFIATLPCVKIFLAHHMRDYFFSIELPDERLVFQPGDYDRLIANEPFTSAIPMEHVNPIIIRNRDEILPREKAREKLGVYTDKPVCLIAANGRPGEYEEIVQRYSYLEKEGYEMVYSTNYREASFFPIVDFFNGVDFIVSGAGYNQFWEIIYFDKEAVFVPVPRRFEDQARRVRECQEFYFDKNGADQLVRIIAGL